MTVSSTASPIEQIDDLTYPTKRDEAWRYAPIADLARLTFGPPTGSTTEVPAEVDGQIPAIDGPRIVIVNGVVDLRRSHLADVPASLRLASLAEETAERPDRVSVPGESVDGSSDAFSALNAAFGRDGAFVELADDQMLEVPIHIVDITIPGESQNGTCTGVTIRVGDRSKATVVETRIGGGDRFGGSNSRTTIDLGAGAILHHIVLQDVPPTQIHLGRIEATLAPGSRFEARSFNLGGRYGRLAYDVHLAGQGAVADLGGLYFGFGDQILDQQITITHGAKDCTSRQAFRGVLDDASTGVFNGGIDVRPGADGTDAEQSNDNLVLSDRAEVNTQPRLEILADDVACKHGATVGQLDDTALYYMRSRGIPADEARRLLISGFADQTVDDVEIGTLRTWIIQRLGHGTGDHLGDDLGDHDA